MKVVLFKSVDNLGAAGEVVDVKRGYFRNYLGPRGYAKMATRGNLALVESQRKKIEAMVARERSEAQVAAQDMTGVALTFQLRANDRGQLFGSVTTTDIAKALHEKGYEVDRRKIELSEHIKALGDFDVKIRLYPEVYAEVKVTVERLLRPDEIQALEEAEKKAAEAEAIAEASEEAEQPAAEAEVAEEAAAEEPVAEESKTE
ncbi:50S ribosomal protein L9 [bacterium]|nr:50S ribosomal protein L9 [bacterium]